MRLSEVAKSIRLASGSRVRFRTRKPAGEVLARSGGRTVGTLRLDPESAVAGGRRIKSIGTDSAVRRQGVGGGMYRTAQARGLRPVHSEDLTPAGAAWKKSVGGPSVPKSKPRKVSQFERDNADVW